MPDLHLETSPAPEPDGSGPENSLPPEMEAAEQDKKPEEKQLQMMQALIKKRKPFTAPRLKKDEPEPFSYDGSGSADFKAMADFACKWSLSNVARAVNWSMGSMPMGEIMAAIKDPSQLSIKDLVNGMNALPVADMARAMGELQFDPSKHNQQTFDALKDLANKVNEISKHTDQWKDKPESLADLKNNQALLESVAALKDNALVKESKALSKLMTAAMQRIDKEMENIEKQIPEAAQKEAQRLSEMKEADAAAALEQTLGPSFADIAQAVADQDINAYKDAITNSPLNDLSQAIDDLSFDPKQDLGTTVALQDLSSKYSDIRESINDLHPDPDNKENDQDRDKDLYNNSMQSVSNLGDNALVEKNENLSKALEPVNAAVEKNRAEELESKSSLPELKPDLGGGGGGGGGGSS